MGRGPAAAAGAGLAAGRGGQPEAYCHRAILDAIRYLVDNGIKWRAMPADFPPWDRVYAFFRRWRDHMLVREFHDQLCDQVSEKAGRGAEPTAGVIDSQSVKAEHRDQRARAEHLRERRPYEDPTPPTPGDIQNAEDEGGEAAAR
ncbi:transposase [Streptomyces sp. NPDC047999]|uniref:transposase n=1 Tax=Streptomyces sp. NPDC047999 TaxID=3365497 RepID=UPI00371C27D1